MTQVNSILREFFEQQVSGHWSTLDATTGEFRPIDNRDLDKFVDKLMPYTNSGEYTVDTAIGVEDMEYKIEGALEWTGKDQQQQARARFVQSFWRLMQSFPIDGQDWAIMSDKNKHRVIHMDLADNRHVAALLNDLFRNSTIAYTVNKYVYHDIPIGITISVKTKAKDESTYYMIAPNKWPAEISNKINFLRACEKTAVNMGGDNI